MSDLEKIVNEHRAWLSGDGGERANLSGANLRGANLREADLREANLRGANLRWADLREVDLREADLREVDLRWANLRGANLREADLSGADLSGANLREADLSGANLRGANLREANLRGANLRGAKGLLLFGTAPSSGRMLYVNVREGNRWYYTGCFSGTEDEFIAAVKEKHGDTQNAAYYLACVEVAKIGLGAADE